jgi:hypothetical protein
MYQELKGNENFSDKYATWIIAYCLDTDSFFATNQRHFFWEYNDEFQCENDAVNYFRNHLDEFINARKDILSHCGGWSIDKDLFLENTKERFSNTNKKSKHTQLPKTSCSIQMPEVALYRNPKVIAKIKLCGAVTINIDEDMAWKKPTDAQIKNLHDLFCIDVEIFDRGE